jgi:chromosome segregation ATPase
MDIVDASVVLAPYLEPLVRGRRVVILGDSSGTLGAALVDRGARLVHVYDPDAVRAAESAARFTSVRSMVIARLPEGELAVRDGAFDSVIVPDMACFGSADELVRQAARLLSPGGSAIFASRNLEGASKPTGGSELTYYELYDAVSLQFPEVRMLGQAPFVGYVIADFAPDEEPDVTVDTSLLEHGAEEPLWFIALASRRPARLDPYAIVQVPLAQAPVAQAPIVVQPKAPVASPELEQSRKQLAALQSDLQGQRDAFAQLRASAPDPAHVAQLQEQLAQTEARAGDAHVRAGRLENKVRDLDEELRHQRERAFKLSRELEEEKKYRTKAELELGMMRRGSELPPKPIELPADTARIEKLEADLGESMHNAARLERQLAEQRRQTSETQSLLDAATDELADTRASLLQLQKRVRDLQSELDERDVRIAQLDAAALDAAAADAAALEAAKASQRASSSEELRAARTEAAMALEQLEHATAEHEAEVAGLEQKLLERARQLDALRRELAHRDQLVRELIGQAQAAALPGFGEGQDCAELRAQLDRLAALSAVRESQLQAASWRVQELEGALARAQSTEPSAQVAELERALYAAQSELDALRKSLQQEHEARERLERGQASADEVSAAHAQLQQQAVLASSVEAARPNDQESVDR